MKKELWQGIDADLETSLFEYGLLICKNKHCTEPDEWFCLVGVGMGMNSDGEADYRYFDTGYIRETELMKEEWIDWDALLSWVGLTKETWLKQRFITRLDDIKSYYGYQNLGFDFYNSFYLSEKDLDEYLEKMEPQETQTL